MISIRVDNVNEALYPAWIHLKETGRLADTRGGDVLELTEPLCTIYGMPYQRVLYMPERRCNPFFHLFEAIWIMAGRRDVAFLAKFNPRMREFSDDGGVFNAAYGHRLRENFEIDQIKEVVRLLKASPQTRRAVLQIWDAFSDLGAHSNDIPCNDTIMFRPYKLAGKDCLDMTVCCRSNDMVWGAYGANAVHFSVLHEVIAAASGMLMGRMYQMSNNFHVYQDNPFYKVLRADRLTPGWNPYNERDGWHVHSPLFDTDKDIDAWLKDAERFCGLVMNYNDDKLNATTFAHSWFELVALPMFTAWIAHKEHRNGLRYIDAIDANDWRDAAALWLQQHGEEL